MDISRVDKSRDPLFMSAPPVLFPPLPVLLPPPPVLLPPPPVAADEVDGPAIELLAVLLVLILLLLVPAKLLPEKLALAKLLVEARGGGMQLPPPIRLLPVVRAVELEGVADALLMVAALPPTPVAEVATLTPVAEVGHTLGAKFGARLTCVWGEREEDVEAMAAAAIRLAEEVG